MAHSVLEFMLKERGIEGVFVDSAAAHRDELGNPPYYLTAEKLRREGVPVARHVARLMTKEDAARFDDLIGMDEYNVRDMKRIAGEYSYKVHKLLDFTPQPRDVADPWYTRDFDKTYEDVCAGLEGYLAHLAERGVI